VLVVPIVSEGDRVVGVVTQWEFFKAFADRLTEA
jgi:CBS domain-containing protein